MLEKPGRDWTLWWEGCRNSSAQTPLQRAYPPDPPFTGTPLSCVHPVSEIEVSNTLKSVSFKSCELDPIPASLFSDCPPYLLPAITDIVKTSWCTGSFSKAFKTAIVHSLLKKNKLDPNDLENYRPVSNLPFIYKLLEKKLSFSSSKTTCQITTFILSSLPTAPSIALRPSSFTL